MSKVYDFNRSLSASHEAEDLPIWRECYEKFFPGLVSMTNHREDGQYQRAGVDRVLVLSSGKAIYVDEKPRFKAYPGEPDIALEYWSNEERGIKGWVNKPLIADYIAYAILPRGLCYLLPVIQLQSAWEAHGQKWIATYKRCEAETAAGRTTYTSVCVAVPVSILFPAIGNCLRATFSVVAREVA